MADDAPARAFTTESAAPESSSNASALPARGDAGKKKLYLETVGCQMNVLDSELVAAQLRGDGYEMTGDIRQADAIL